MTNKEVALSFISTWRGQQQTRLEAELQSLFNETHRRPDSYSFKVTEGGLIDPETKSSIKSFIEKDTSLEQVEFRVLETLEEWAEKSSEGVAVWVSPPYPDKYPCSKIIISKIAYEWPSQQKVLLNSAILFDAKDEGATKIASEIAQKEFQNPEEVRGSLFVFDDQEEVVIKILDFVRQYLPPVHKHTENAPRRQVQGFLEMIKSDVSPQFIVYEMQRSGFLGQHAISCPSSSLTSSSTFSDVILSHSNVINLSETAKFVKNCGNCGKPINRVISAGYQCTCGGVYEGC